MARWTVERRNGALVVKSTTVEADTGAEARVLVARQWKVQPGSLRVRPA